MIYIIFRFIFISNYDYTDDIKELLSNNEFRDSE